jgi:hypothetical protein
MVIPSSRTTPTAIKFAERASTRAGAADSPDAAANGTAAKPNATSVKT